MRSLMIIGLSLLLPGCNTWSNKPTVPEMSRTAVVHDVRVSLTDIQPADLRANVGDEIRFLNDKTQPIRVVLIEAGKSIACNKGFNGMIDQEADVKPGQYASFCFSKPGTVKYMARDRTAVTGGEVVLPAQIHVETNTARPLPESNYPSVGRAADENWREVPQR
jgi:plastocyanin